MAFRRVQETWELGDRRYHQKTYLRMFNKSRKNWIIRNCPSKRIRILGLCRRKILSLECHRCPTFIYPVRIRCCQIIFGWRAFDR